MPSVHNTGQPWRVVIADDEPLMRQGLVLERAGDIEVVAEGADGAEAIELVGQHRPDLVLLDIRMDGIEATRRIVDDGGARVVLLTTFAVPCSSARSAPVHPATC